MKITKDYDIRRENLTRKELKLIESKRLIERLKESPDPSWTWQNRENAVKQDLHLTPQDVLIRAAILIGEDLEVMLHRRKLLCVKAKQASIYIIRKIFPLVSYPGLTRIMCPQNRYHTTVYTAHKKAKENINKDDSFRRFVACLFLAIEKYPTPISGPDALESLRIEFERDGLLFTATPCSVPVPADSGSPQKPVSVVE